MSLNVQIGILGGTGLYAMKALTAIEEHPLQTPFGAPSDSYLVGNLEGVRVAFLARHGRGHRILPSELNFRANIHGFKQLGVTHLIGVSAVGSLQERYRPLDIVLPDQFYDRTKTRINTFFGDGVVAHVGFADPICPDLARLLFNEVRSTGATAHLGGTLVCMEGPAFSTRAESRVYRSWGMDLIGMTTLQEAKLAREAEICYAALSLVTDYDCWHVEEADVSVNAVLQNLLKNTASAQTILQQAVPKISTQRNCGCGQALENAIITAPELMPPETRKRLQLIIGKYVP